MNKKILLSSLGVLAIIGVAILSPAGSLLRSSSISTGDTNVPGVMPNRPDRRFTSEDGKKMYTLTFNADGTRKYSVEVPTSYTDTYTDEYGTHEQPIDWEFDFPREVVSNMALSQEYYSAESVAKWAPVFYRDQSSLFEKELTEAQGYLAGAKKSIANATEKRTEQEKIIKTCTEKTVPEAEKALSDARKKMEADTKAKEEAQNKINLLATKNAELIVTNNTLTVSLADMNTELTKTIPARKVAIKKEIAANTAKIAANKTKIAANTKTINANTKTITSNDTKITNNKAIISANNRKLGIVTQENMNDRMIDGQLTAAQRKTLMDQNATLSKTNSTLTANNEKLADQNKTLLADNETRTNENTTLTTKNTELSTEQNTTIPNRIKELNGTLLTEAYAPSKKLTAEIDTLKKEIAKLPTLAAYDGMIQGDLNTIGKADAQLTKAKSDCEVEKKKMLGMDASIAMILLSIKNGEHKVCTMVKAKNPAAESCEEPGIGGGNITSIDWDTERATSYFQSMTDSELQSYIDEITKVINGGVVPGTTTPLTSSQLGNANNNLGTAQNEKNTRDNPLGGSNDCSDGVINNQLYCKITYPNCQSTSILQNYGINNIEFMSNTPGVNPDSEGVSHWKCTFRHTDTNKNFTCNCEKNDVDATGCQLQIKVHTDALNNATEEQKEGEDYKKTKENLGKICELCQMPEYDQACGRNNI